MNRISVVGSINVDLVVKAQKRPLEGETVFGDSFSIKAGGKGANQAVAIARLGGHVKMFGCVGDDVYAEAMIKNLDKNGVDTNSIRKVKDVSTGVASITVSGNDNSIIVVKGANDYVDINYINSVMDEILKSDIVLMQFEIPIKTIEYIVEICYKNNIKVILNPAPISSININSLEKVNYIIPNQHEAVLMFEGIKDIEQILHKYPRKIIVTLGEKGVSYCNGNDIINIPIINNADVVDTTGAGDTFSGAFTKALGDEMEIDDALTFAQCASSMSVEKFGAQEGMPTLEEVLERQRVNNTETIINNCK